MVLNAILLKFVFCTEVDVNIIGKVISEIILKLYKCTIDINKSQ